MSDKNHKDNKDTYNLTFEFPTSKARDLFAEWLCGQGEQDYWLYAEENKDAKHTVGFDYHNSKTDKEDGTQKFGKFIADNTIRCSLKPTRA